MRRCRLPQNGTCALGGKGLILMTDGKVHFREGREKRGMGELFRADSSLCCPGCQALDL